MQNPRMAEEILNETRNLISTQMKMLDRAESETERLLKRNKLNELQKHLANIEKRILQEDMRKRCG